MKAQFLIVHSNCNIIEKKMSAMFKYESSLMHYNEAADHETTFVHEAQWISEASYLACYDRKRE